MADLAADLELESRGVTEYCVFKVTADDCIYKGALVCIDTDGFALPAADAASYVFVGIAVEKADNTGGSDGDIYVKVARNGQFKLAGAALAQTHVGRELCVGADDNHVTDVVATNDVKVGIMTEYLSATSAWVDIGMRTLNPTT